MMRDSNGFTLIELIIVIVIIGILAAIAAPMMSGMKAKAMCAEAVTAMGTIRNAVRQYYVEYNGFPDSWTTGTKFLDDSTVRDPFSAVGLNVDNLKGLYGSKECYRIGISVNGGVTAGAIRYYPRPDAASGRPNDGIKADEAKILVPDHPDGYLYMNIVSGKITQQYMPQSGYPGRQFDGTD